MGWKPKHTALQVLRSRGRIVRVWFGQGVGAAARVLLNQGADVAYHAGVDPVAAKVEAAGVVLAAWSNRIRTDAIEEISGDLVHDFEEIEVIAQASCGKPVLIDTDDECRAFLKRFGLGYAAREEALEELGKKLAVINAALGADAFGDLEDG